MSSGAVLRAAVLAALVLLALGAGAVLLMQTPTAAGGWLRCGVERTVYERDEVGALPDDFVVVQATVQTDPVDDPCDAADDPAIWLDPQQPGRGFVVGSNKVRGLDVYALDGARVDHVAIGRVNNVDLRDGIELAGALRVIVAASDKAGHFDVLSLDPETGALTDHGEIPTRPEEETYGFCLYRPDAGSLEAFVTDKSGAIEHWTIGDDGAGSVAGTFLRTLRVSSQPEGCVVDDDTGQLYVGEEEVGIWRFDAAVDGAQEGTLIARTGLELGPEPAPDAHLFADVEGLAIYAPTDSDEAGYLVASSQGNSSYVLFDRAPPHAYRGTFVVEIEGRRTGDTDGLDVTALEGAAGFDAGMLVVQDGINAASDGSYAHQNFKFVPWASIASALSLDEAP